MTNEEAIRELKADYCGNRIICELYPDQCNREDCEIWWAINALENAKNDNLTPESSQNVPNQAFKMQKSYVRSNTISRRAVIETVRDADVCVCYSENESVEIENVIDLAIRATKGSVIASIEQLPSAQPEPCADTVSRTAAIEAQERIMSDHPLDGYEDGRLLINALKALPSVQPNLKPACNQLATNTISRQAVKYKLTALVNELEEIFSDIRERNVDDSVCGLCEYDGAYIGQSGGWCNECPGFDKDDCFKLKEKYREEWLKIDG